MMNRFTKFDIGFMQPKKPRPRKSKPKPAPSVVNNSPKGFKQLTAFALTAFVLILVLQSLLYASSAHKASGEILGVANSAYTELNAATANISTQNFAAAGQLFDAANENIQIALEKLDEYKLLSWIVPQANSANHILSGASYLSEAGKKLTVALGLFDELKISSGGIETENINNKIKENHQIISETLELVSKSREEFNQAGSLPLDFSKTFDQAKEQTSQLESLLKQLVGLEDLYLSLFAGQKNYLLIFQNSDEMRATGGFIGTYGNLKINNGAINNLKIEGIYALDSLIYEPIAAPGPLQPYIKRWGIRDANWFVDFPASARKLLYFYEKGAETADGVLAMTPQFFKNVLELVGPIEMPDYDVVLTPENFQQVVQYKTSVDFDPNYNPKKFLADFAPILLNRMTSLNKDQWLKVLQIFEDNLHSRQILLYSADPQTQRKISDLGFAGQILDAKNDYLGIFNTNLGGTKTDLSIEQSAHLVSKILSDGSVVNTLGITRKNLDTESNRDYVRILVPQGSKLVSASNFNEEEHYDSISEGLTADPDLAVWDQGEMHSNVFVRSEAGKTEFAGWVKTNAQDEKTVSLTYILPMKVSYDHSFSLLLQKQAGSKPYQFDGQIILGNFGVSWFGPEMNLADGVLSFSSNSNTDDFWPAIITK